MARRCGGSPNSLLLVLWLGLCGFTVSPQQGTFTVDYVEPTTNADGSALTNLTLCTPKVTGWPALGGGLVTFSTIPASVGTGGGTQSVDLNVVWGPVSSQALPLQFIVTCTNSTSQESVQAVFPLTIDPYPLDLQ